MTRSLLSKDLVKIALPNFSTYINNADAERRRSAQIRMCMYLS